MVLTLTLGRNGTSLLLRNFQKSLEEIFWLHFLLTNPCVVRRLPGVHTEKSGTSNNSINILRRLLACLE